MKNEKRVSKNYVKKPDDITEIYIIIALLICVAIGLLSGCRSESKVTFGGQATVRSVVDINFAVCDSLPDSADRVECVKALLTILEEATAKSASLGGAE